MKERCTRCCAAWKPRVFLASEWREENKRNKRFYSFRGRRADLQQLLQEWETINASLDRILQEAQ